MSDLGKKCDSCDHYVTAGNKAELQKRMDAHITEEHLEDE